jgi:spermidine synthase
LVFCSGWAGLVYQVLWLQQLGLLFGNTSHAAAATLTAFFTGLAAGSWFWGQRAARAANPLRWYAGLELGIVVTALGYFLIRPLYHGMYPVVFEHVTTPAGRLGIKFVLALLLVFPPAFCMGGTVPLIGQYRIRDAAAFGVTAARLYAVNTLGAALGAFVAGFFLPAWRGYNRTLAGAMLVSGAVAAGAWVLSRRTPGRSVRAAPMPVPVAAPGRVTIRAVAFLSGFGVLALEVMWTRMMAQVLENSVYTFAAILVVVLLGLAGGAFGSAWLARRRADPGNVLAGLLVLGGAAAAVTPLVFLRLTDSLQVLVSTGSWARYVGLIFQTAALAMGPAVVVLGTIFPYLMKIEERYLTTAGESLGRLAGWNIAGAMVGPVVGGFVLLGEVGMWRSMQWIAALYGVAAMALPVGRGLVWKAVAGLFLVWLMVGLEPARWPVRSVDPLREPGEVVETWEGSDSTVAVTRDRRGLSLQINSHYGLGSTGASALEQLQAGIPLRAYPATTSIFFLGMGTGITAGHALAPEFPRVRRVVACELVPEVVTAARRYFTHVEGTDYTGGLFRDPRATVIVEDGRHYLQATRESFDMINADLFVPFRSGAGSLYSREHFASVRARLAPGGVFFQWLPLYQLTEFEFGVIVRTMLEVFDQVSLWRNTFQPGEEVVALAGHPAGASLPAASDGEVVERRAAVAGKDHRDLERLWLPLDAETIPFFYAGNVTAARELFAGYPVNTDDRPVIEYQAPRTYRKRTTTAIPWFVGPRLAKLVDEVQRRCPPARDPLLVNRSAAQRRLPLAGAAFHWARLWAVMGQEARCREAWEQFVAEWTDAPVR